mgnify:CR=1 FL=1
MFLLAFLYGTVAYGLLGMVVLSIDPSTRVSPVNVLLFLPGALLGSISYAICFNAFQLQDILQWRWSFWCLFWIFSALGGRLAVATPGLAWYLMFRTRALAESEDESQPPQTEPALSLWNDVKPF